MALRFKCSVWPLLLSVSIAAVSAAAVSAAADKPKFDAKPAAEYSHHQTSEKITIAAQSFITDEETHEAFGKVNPNRYSVLPILVVIQNDSPDAIRADGMKLVYTIPGGSHIESTPAKDVRFLRGPQAPKQTPGPVVAGIHITRPPKNPLSGWEIEGRAFSAKMIPPGQSASGFAYFQVPEASSAASLYITGLTDPVSGRELYYFEIPLSGN